VPRGRDRDARAGRDRIKPITTAHQLAANRANARKSTGPRTAAGKARSRGNARRHGFAARALGARGADPAFGRIVAALCAADGDPLLREQAVIIADAQLQIQRIRMARVTLGDDPAGGANGIAEIMSLDRYERRALSRRRRAIARYGAILELAQRQAQGRGQARGIAVLRAALCNLQRGLAERSQSSVRADSARMESPRVPHAMQREAVHRRCGTPVVQKRRRNRGPGSAAHHFVLRRARDTGSGEITVLRAALCNLQRGLAERSQSSARSSPRARRSLLRPRPSKRASTPVFDGLCGETAAPTAQQTRVGEGDSPRSMNLQSPPHPTEYAESSTTRSEERRVGKECRSRWSPYH